MIYDTVVIGAGIAGCSIAYFLKKRDQKVLLIDKIGVASGGSGAAGAFLSPKIGVSSPLKDLTDDAFNFTIDFYKKNFPQYYHQTGVIRVPKNELDASKTSKYSKFHNAKYEELTPAQVSSLGFNVKYNSTLFFDGGTCDAREICMELAKDIDFLCFDVKDITKTDDIWMVGDKKVKNIVLATGFENSLFDMRYMGIKGTWGNRADFSSQLKLDVSLHESLSISANMGGVIKLGATHELEVKEPKPCDDSKSYELLKNASNMIDISDFKLIKTYCGMRSGSRDFSPVVGKVIDATRMFEYPYIFDGRKYPTIYHDNLYILNGLGARGFVLAPYLANELTNLIVEQKPIDKRANADRLFWNWVRKLNRGFL
ncbi:MAG: FAD-dependent oxidoreductase [Sulfurovum sp. AS07-7]|nr:MAG: FAD-dependent oxidoreductase [Sulfurovum sp. AS07-7]